MGEPDLVIYTFNKLHERSAFRYRSQLLVTTPMYIRAQKIAISAARSPEMNPWSGIAYSLVTKCFIGTSRIQKNCIPSRQQLVEILWPNPTHTKSSHMLPCSETNLSITNRDLCIKMTQQHVYRPMYHAYRPLHGGFISLHHA